MIQSFRDKRTQALANGERVPAFASCAKTALKKLIQLDAAMALNDLILPGNRLEKLSGDRGGQYSIRVNDQWTICFEWPSGESGPCNVEIVDYH